MKSKFTLLQNAIKANDGLHRKNILEFRTAFFFCVLTITINTNKSYFLILTGLSMGFHNISYCQTAISTPFNCIQLYILGTFSRLTKTVFLPKMSSLLTLGKKKEIHILQVSQLNYFACNYCKKKTCISKFGDFYIFKSFLGCETYLTYLHKTFSKSTGLSRKCIV